MKSVPFCQCLCALVLFGLLPSCSKKSPAREEIVPLPQLTSQNPLSDERRLRLEAFGKELAASVREGDAVAFEKLFSHKRFGELTIQGMRMPSARYKRDFVSGFVKGLKRNEGGVSHAFLGQGYAFLRVLDYQGQHRVLCRLYDSETGVNYHAYACETSTDGRVRAIDFYNYASRESTSDAVRRLAVQAIAANEDRSLVESMFSKKDALLASEMKNVRRFGEVAQARKVDEGLKIYNALPEAPQKEKSVMIMWTSLLAIRDEDERAYAEALKLYADTFPNDPSLTLMMVDYHIVTEDYPSAFAALDTIEEDVGPDPALDVLRSNIALTQTDHEKALRLAERALSADPTFEDAHWSAIAAASPLENYACMLAHLLPLRDTFDYEFDPAALRAEELYQKFMESPEAESFFGNPIE